MPSYRIHRLKDHLRHQFRYAPHVSGSANVRPRDYETAETLEQIEQHTIEAPSPYAAFHALRSSERPLEVGDLLESPDGSLRICKFVGFEEAKWVLPEPKPMPGAQEAPVEGAVLVGSRDS
jgi:hypothetical protein